MNITPEEAESCIPRLHTKEFILDLYCSDVALQLRMATLTDDWNIIGWTLGSEAPGPLSWKYACMFQHSSTCQKSWHRLSGASLRQIATLMSKKQ